MEFFSSLPKVKEVFPKKGALGHCCIEPRFCPTPTFEENVDFLNSDCDETRGSN